MHLTSLLFVLCPVSREILRRPPTGSWMYRERASADLRRPNLREVLLEARFPWFTVRVSLRQAGQVTFKLRSRPRCRRD